MKELCFICTYDESINIVDIYKKFIPNNQSIKYIIMNKKSYNKEFYDLNFETIDKLKQKVNHFIITETIELTDSFIVELIRRLLIKDNIIYNFHRLQKNDLSILENLAIENETKLLNFNCNNILNQKLKKIDIPIVAVCSLFPNMNKLEVELQLEKKFNDLGYNAKSIVSNEYGFILNKDIFPFSLLNNNSIKIIEKLNNYIYQKSKGDYDLLLLGIPGGFLKIEDLNVNNDYGLLYYEIFNCCKPDFVIMNVFNNNEVSELEVLSNEFRKKYDCKIDCFIFTDKILDNIGYDVNLTKKLLRINKNNSLFINTNQLNKFDYFDENIYNKISKLIINKL